MNENGFEQHNEEVRQVWEAYRAGSPLRAPMLLSGNSRIWVLDPSLNQDNITWEQFISDPEVMFTTQLKFRHYWAHHFPQDTEMGIPAKCWQVGVEFHNVVEETWFGCPVTYPPGQVSASLPAFSGEKKWDIFEQQPPQPFEGIYAQMRQFYEYFKEKTRDYEFYGKPIEVLPPGALVTDGPFTIATGVRGTEILEDILLDEDYYHQLMEWITSAVIQRIQAWRAYLGIENLPKNGFFADDAIQFLSVKMYQEKVLPYHRRLLVELFGEGPHAMHLCGNVQRLLPLIVRQLGVNSFDTGYPINWDTLRDDVGEDVEIMGGVPVSDLQQSSPAAVSATSQKILASGVLRGGKFIFKEANNLPPRSPLENIHAMYHAVKKWGRFEQR
jgi:hypothetical protein